jgi:hypothetical protein
MTFSRRPVPWLGSTLGRRSIIARALFPADERIG